MAGVTYVLDAQVRNVFGEIVKRLGRKERIEVAPDHQRRDVDAAHERRRCVYRARPTHQQHQTTDPETDAAMRVADSDEGPHPLACGVAISYRSVAFGTR